MAILKLDNLFIIFGAILFILTSLSVISFTSKFIFGIAKNNKSNTARQLYDPDVCNTTSVCPFETDPYQVHYNRTVCFNKTLHYRYIPWIRHDVWRKFEEMNDEKRRIRARELEAVNEGENEANETLNEISNEKLQVVATDATANRDDREEPSKVVCTILAALLILSSVFAFGEVIKEKFLTKKTNSPTEVKHGLSPADEDVAHIRSQSGEQSAEAVRSAKVTQTLVHQTSLDKAFSRLSSEVRPFYPRRESVTSRMTASGLAANTPDTGSMIDKYFQASDAQPVRRGSRHLIRRH